MEVSKESLQEDVDKEYEPDKSAVSQIFRLIRGMATKGEEASSPRKSKRRRLGKGPGRERDMDVDSDEEESVEELAFIDIRARVLRAGFTEAQLNQTVTEVCLFILVLCRRLTRYFFLYSTKTSMCGSE